MRKIRWGILSTGGIAATFTQDLLTLPDAEVVAVGSRTAAAAAAFADRYGIPHAHGSWQDLAADPDVDVVYVATPHAGHHAAAVTCVEAGKAVLVEKAFTINVAEATDLIERARARGVFVMEAMWTAFLPAVRRAIELAADGAIGQVRAVTADFGLTGYFPPEHRLRAPELGGGALLDLGVYPVWFSHLFLGTPSTVAAAGTLTTGDVDETTSISFGHDSGAVSALVCSLSADLTGGAVVTGSAGRLEIPGFFAASRFTMVGGGKREEVVLPPRAGGYVHEAEEVMRCLREGRTESPVLPHADTLAVMETLDTIRSQVGIRYPADAS